jgi:Mlc titration factor MtfA (ptsG expression regulator)
VTFFQLPVEMQDDLPDVYHLLEDYFGQDPVARQLR